jgi:hypothetical protein
MSALTQRKGTMQMIIAMTVPFRQPEIERAALLVQRQGGKSQEMSAGHAGALRPFPPEKSESRLEQITLDKHE